MEANYVHKDSTTLVQDELVKNELNQIELQYNALKQQKFNELLKENQELKLELSGYRQAILNNKEMLGLKEQNDKLKKQLENKYKKVGTLTSELLYEENTKLINQQKEFIKWLEDEIQNKREKSTTLTAFIRNVVPLQQCLQKYKSIIGVSDENNIK